MGAPARIVKTRGGGAGAAPGAAGAVPAPAEVAGAAPGLAAAFEATAPGLLAALEVAFGVGEADVRSVVALGEGLGCAVAAFPVVLDEQPSCASNNATTANPQTA